MCVLLLILFTREIVTYTETRRARSLSFRVKGKSEQRGECLLLIPTLL